MDRVLDLMRRMGENVSPTSFEDCMLKDTNSVYGKVIIEAPIIINEGLITTYDSSMVLNAICDSFHLAKNGKRKEILTYTMKGLEYIYIGEAFLEKNENGEDIIKITLDANESFIATIEKRMNKYGWTLFRDDLVYGKTVFSFEKKYPTCGTVSKLLRFTNKLYHIAPENVVHKIMKQGLIPKKSKTLGLYNEPRIYLWVNEPEDNQWEEMFDTRGKQKGILLSIDLTKLNPEHKIYFDNRMPNALFSLEPISCNAIEIISK